MKTRIVFCMSMMFAVADMFGSSSFEQWRRRGGGTCSDNSDKVAGYVRCHKVRFDAEDLLATIPSTPDNAFQFLAVQKLIQASEAAWGAYDPFRRDLLACNSERLEDELVLPRNIAEAYAARITDCKMREVYNKVFEYANGAKIWTSWCKAHTDEDVKEHANWKAYRK